MVAPGWEPRHRPAAWPPSLWKTGERCQPWLPHGTTVDLTGEVDTRVFTGPSARMSSPDLRSGGSPDSPSDVTSWGEASSALPTPGTQHRLGQGTGRGGGGASIILSRTVGAGCAEWGRQGLSSAAPLPLLWAPGVGRRAPHGSQRALPWRAPSHSQRASALTPASPGSPQNTDTRGFIGHETPSPLVFSGRHVWAWVRPHPEVSGWHAVRASGGENPSPSEQDLHPRCFPQHLPESE